MAHFSGIRCAILEMPEKDMNGGRNGGGSMEQGNGIKVYVRVKVQFDEEGRMRPQAILWEDGRRFEIEKVTDIRPAPALRAGGQGDRYTVRIGKRESYLFFERLAFPAGCVQGRWFVERRRG